MKEPIVQAYLFFNGCCEEAVAFYARAIGAQIEMTMRYKESPDPTPPGMLPAGWDDKIMHTSFRVGSTVIMASDGCGEDPGFKGFSLTFTLPSEAEARRAFDSLAEGGRVMMPMARTFWSPCFGMLTDRFGVGWMVMVEG